MELNLLYEDRILPRQVSHSHEGSSFFIVSSSDVPLSPCCLSFGIRPLGLPGCATVAGNVPDPGSMPVARPFPGITTGFGPFGW